MKACLAICLLCTLLYEVVCQTVGPPIAVATDLVVPVTTNSVNLQMPYCYFEGTAPECSGNADKSLCKVWLVSSLSSETIKYDSSSEYKAPYQGAYTATGKNYSTVLIDSLDKIGCPATQPYNFQVGKDKGCSGTYCNGLLPEGENMSFKYILVHNENVVSKTDWSKNITLRSVQTPETLGSGYAGRSAAMVVITTILAVAAALLLLLLLTALILICCHRTKATGSYETGHKPSLMGSLRIPSYDVHNLRKPSPYDNPAYEQNLKKRNTTASTLPQTVTTVISQVPSNSPENVIVHRL